MEWFNKPGLGAGEMEFVEVGEIDRWELSSSPGIKFGNKYFILTRIKNNFKEKKIK